jgi:hypothetical protein
MARIGVRERLLRRLSKRALRRAVLREWGKPDDQGDDGSAGVREPRRPVHPPSDLVAEEPIP